MGKTSPQQPSTLSRQSSDNFLAMTDNVPVHDVDEHDLGGARAGGAGWSRDANESAGAMTQGEGTVKDESSGPKLFSRAGRIVAAVVGTTALVLLGLALVPTVETSVSATTPSSPSLHKRQSQQAIPAITRFSLGSTDKWSVNDNPILSFSRPNSADLAQALNPGTVLPVAFSLPSVASLPASFRSVASLTCTIYGVLNPYDSKQYKDVLPTVRWDGKWVLASGVMLPVVAGGAASVQVPINVPALATGTNSYYLRAVCDTVGGGSASGPVNGGVGNRVVLSGMSSPFQVRFTGPAESRALWGPTLAWEPTNPPNLNVSYPSSGDIISIRDPVPLRWTTRVATTGTGFTCTVGFYQDLYAETVGGVLTPRYTAYYPLATSLQYEPTINPAGGAELILPFSILSTSPFYYARVACVDTVGGTVSGVSGPFKLASGAVPGPRTGWKSSWSFATTETTQLSIFNPLPGQYVAVGTDTQQPISWQIGNGTAIPAGTYRCNITLLTDLWDDGKFLPSSRNPKFSNLVSIGTNVPYNPAAQTGGLGTIPWLVDTGYFYPSALNYIRVNCAATGTETSVLGGVGGPFKLCAAGGYSDGQIRSWAGMESVPDAFSGNAQTYASS
ncbi:hypothetical protein M427DRAFT_55735 [Gonapodya prolifera JEL478]|uniref:Uncharacterized protein n=1 Tax=Gonapodya prolifera (strain JEL478) TaxID=1344416 RepID=A0A139AHL8_GONPJ|nr:hypothetical protein M427DRAFT_55735 [Gonapodya prolifera JEL478]|eukprot:KXS16306.1 hypothetical protein M427DRAFT_55735 [Gonapodya prolifera JEL478]